MLDSYTPWGYIEYMATDPQLTQLKRISGQLEGIVRMYESERDCIDVVHQIVAVKNSLNRVAKDLLTTEACSCSGEQDIDRLDTVLKELLR
ncbi:MAG: transcriptional regulator [Candidatus Pacebacteria bacterium CG10_big_fil_rev_8_21_14_0_10_42_12]|nr:MAG: transcriptional regulator [Candidatus Pacebacteria bacterium CG10_big_fil_rev_8_21_14_0_10_42_12]